MCVSFVFSRVEMCVSRLLRTANKYGDQETGTAVAPVRQGGGEQRRVALHAGVSVGGSGSSGGAAALRCGRCTGDRGDYSYCKRAIHLHRGPLVIAQRLHWPNPVAPPRTLAPPSLQHPGQHLIGRLCATRGCPLSTTVPSKEGT